MFHEFDRLDPKAIHEFQNRLVLIGGKHDNFDKTITALRNFEKIVDEKPKDGRIVPFEIGRVNGYDAIRLSVPWFLRAPKSFTLSSSKLDPRTDPDGYLALLLKKNAGLVHTDDNKVEYLEALPESPA